MALATVVLKGLHSWDSTWMFTACGVDLVYWILCLSLGKLVLVGHSKSCIKCHWLTLPTFVSYITGIWNVDSSNMHIVIIKIWTQVWVAMCKCRNYQLFRDFNQNFGVSCKIIGLYAIRYPLHFGLPKLAWLTHNVLFRHKAQFGNP